MQLKIKENGSIPRHVAIIMDGNGRWALSQNKPRTDGHLAGITSVRSAVKAASDLGVRTLTLYVFSTENWKRPKVEIDFIFSLIDEFILKELPELNKNQVVLRSMGNTSDLPEKTKLNLEYAKKTLSNNHGLTLNLALNYSSRDEIIRACKKVSSRVLNGDIEVSQICEDTFTKALDTSGLDDPDLMIRTSGEKRLSNFLLWQLAYGEFYFIDEAWPNFREEHFFKSIIEYQNRKRRYGGL